MPSATLQQAEENFQKAYEFLKKEYSTLHTGRADARLVEGVEVDSYGSKQPLKHLANLSVDGQSIVISPWDKSMLQPIEKAIENNSKLSFSMKNDGVTIRLNVPSLTEERRKEISKTVHQIAENARINVRNVRHEVINTLKKKKEDSEISEDAFYRAEKELQEKVDDMNKKIDELAKTKEQEIMTV